MLKILFENLYAGYLGWMLSYLGTSVTENPLKFFALMIPMIILVQIAIYVNNGGKNNV